MPNCFSLARIGSSTPEVLTTVDSAICQNLGLEWHPKYWAFAWYDDIGFAIACGKDYDWLYEDTMKLINDPEISDLQRDVWRTRLRILHFLRENYTHDAWAEIGRGR